MYHTELKVYKGTEVSCEQCKRFFKEKEVISVTTEGLTFCYSDGDGGCLLLYVMTQGVMLVGHPMIVPKGKEQSIPDPTPTHKKRGWLEKVRAWL